jgi:hypothetical protein
MKFIGADPMALIEKATGAVAQFVDTPEKKHAFELAVAQLKQEEQVAQMNRETEAAKIAHDERMAEFADTASARSIRGVNEVVQAVLACIFTTCFFALSVFILFWMRKAGLDSTQTNIIFLIFGAVSGIMVTIVGFYFGSSAGSKGKDDVIKNLQGVTNGKG